MGSKSFGRPPKVRRVGSGSRSSLSRQTTCPAKLFGKPLEFHEQQEALVDRKTKVLLDERTVDVPLVRLDHRLVRSSIATLAYHVAILAWSAAVGRALKFRGCATYMRLRRHASLPASGVWAVCVCRHRNDGCGSGSGPSSISHRGGRGARYCGGAAARDEHGLRRQGGDRARAFARARRSGRPLDDVTRGGRSASRCDARAAFGVERTGASPRGALSTVRGFV